VRPPEAADPRNIEVTISLRVDADVLEWFKAQAAPPGALPYQTQMNRALRATMNGHVAKADLLDDDAFIDAVAERVRRRSR
jgi:hypothetical protein